VSTKANFIWVNLAFNVLIRGLKASDIMEGAIVTFDYIEQTIERKKIAPRREN
jgi:hypothetical protein